MKHFVYGFTFMLLATAAAVTTYSVGEGVGFTKGKKSVPPEDCTSEVQVAEQGAYGAGVTDTVKQVQAYILDSCTSLKELTVAGETFVCLKKQEM